MVSMEKMKLVIVFRGCYGVVKRENYYWKVVILIDI